MLAASAALALAGSLAGALAGCGDDSPAPAPEPSVSTSPAPAYDGSLPPARAVMALVPTDATSLAVTDLDQVKQDFGLESVTSTASAADQADFWRRADREAAMVTPGLLRRSDAELRSRFGFGAADVAWEATFSGTGGSGWVIRFADRVPMATVRQAVRAGVGPLGHAEVDAADHLVSHDAATPGEPNWAGVPGLPPLVDAPAAGTYVGRGCLPGDPGQVRLQPLDGYAVQLASTIATARLSTDRDDLFTRMHLAARLPAFRAVFTHGVADPSSGRIGYRMSDPAAAAEVVLRRQLPFAVCD